MTTLREKILCEMLKSEQEIIAKDILNLIDREDLKEEFLHKTTEELLSHILKRIKEIQKEGGKI